MKGHSLSYLIKNKIFQLLIFISLPLISFFFSLYQLNLQYDGFHHGVMFVTIQDLLKEKVPYKEFLPHYGLIFIYLSSIFVKIFSNSIFGLYFLVSLCKGITILLFGIIIKKKFNQKIAISTMLIVFLLMPFVDTPWPEYLFLTFVLISIYLLIIDQNKYSLFISGFFFSIAGLTKDNFIIVLFLTIISYSFFLVYLKIYKKKKIENNFLNFFWILGYILPLLFFIVYLSNNHLVANYLDHFKIGSIAIRNYCTSNVDIFVLRSFDCGLISLQNLINLSYSKIFTEPYWFLFLLIIITNIYFISNVSFFYKQMIIKKEKNLMIFISLLSIILFSNTLYFLTIQRLYTGVLIGIIVVIYLIQTLKSPIYKYSIYVLISVFLLNGFQLARTPNHPIYPTYTKKYKNTYENLKFLKYKKLSKNEWQQLNDFEILTTKTKKRCPFINYSTNLTNDVFFRVILEKNFEILNFIPFGPRDKYITDMYKFFDKSYFRNLNQEIKRQNIIIAIDDTLKMKNNLKNNIDLYLLRNIKYNNYGTKFVSIFLPKKCKF